MESTEALVLIKPNGLVEAKYRTILEFLSLNLIEEVDRKLVWLNDTQLKNIYPACIDRKNYQTWSDSITSGVSLALKVRGEGIVFKLLEIEAELKELLGEVANKSGDDSVEITQEIDEASQELDAIFNNSVKEVKSTDYKIDFEKWSKTRAKHTKVQTTVVILKPDVAQNPDNVKRIKEIITNRGFRICSSREKRLSRKDAIRLCKNEGREWSEKEIIFLSTSDSIIMEIEGEEAVFSLNVMAGTRDPEKCEEKQSLR
ncbi:Nucleoside diphosphate kinase 2 [Zancudomyces culisetae]|uniref:Nucleoside diphosphate kinase n=1 Tax=Zancudomyces culisetae TaxID=1213189 RepID=A0A1R1PK67_ZANCU|nr:Nucleoside diphosphate kinase 2 [Zancudomyces culisetae]|eukprot:OMH81329.1 Nucleoside diphosphate kinase 2 [Zancudomyces culisetae]